MKTLTKTLTLDSQFLRLYRPLVRNLLIIIVTTLVLGAAALLYFDHRLVGSLSEGLIEKSTLTTNEKLLRLFDVADRELRIAQHQIESLEIGNGAQAALLYDVLQPFLAELDMLDSINLADTAGNEYVLIKQPGEILTRRVDGNDIATAHWQRHAGTTVVETWTRRNDVPARERPWYRGAVARDPGASFWTAPYTFLTTNEPGVSVSSRQVRPGGGSDYVIAFNLSLTDISLYTTRLRPSANGMTVIFNQEGRTIGLPPALDFEDEQDLLSAVLMPIEELGVPALDKALATWKGAGSGQGKFKFRTSDQATWWAGFSTLSLNDEKKIWSAVLIPESDFLGSLVRLRTLTLAGIALTGLLAAGGAFFGSMRSIRREMKAAMDQMERRLGQYHLKQKIGEGGNGAVYRAQHALLRRPTAIKLMSAEFARSEAARERFEHEVQITSNLSHPNTIAVYDYGSTPDGTLYYAMELLDGSTLEEVVRFNGPLPAGRVIHIMQQIAGSLAEAHHKGLIHRDVKPSNAILCERGGLFDVVKVLDFGLVKEIAQAGGDLAHGEVLVGTPLYMAPEIIRNPGQASPGSDLYALGAVGYFLLTARNVFEGGNTVEICASHLHDTPVPPSIRAGLPVASDLEAIILSCLAKTPDERPDDAAALRESLLACRDAGAWSQQQAREWWQAHSARFADDASPQTAAPLTNTEFLVDLDQRLATTVHLKVER